MTAKHRLWLLSLGLCVGSLILAVGLTEAGLRLLAPQPTGLSRQDRYGLAMHAPNITRYLPQYGTTVSFNSSGMRDTEHSISKAPGTFRILLLGDSFMEALQVPFEAAFPRVLSTRLEQASGMPVEVINAGVSGWGTDDELRYLTSYGLAYHPDLVVVAMTLHNDISDNLREDWHTIRGGKLVEQSRVPMSYWSFELVEVKSFLASHFQSYQLWRRVRHGGEIRQTGKQLNSHIVQLFQDPVPDRIEWGYGLTSRLLEQMQQVVEAAGGRLVLVLLPLRVQLSDSLFGDFAKPVGLLSGRVPLDSPQRRMKAIADSLGLPVIDLLPGFRQWTSDSVAPLYLEWDGHWNENGHQLAADIAATQLIGSGAIDDGRSKPQ